MFYENLKQEILSLLEQKKYQEALTLIENELNYPYVPPDFEMFLKKHQKLAQEALNINSKFKEQYIDLKDLKLMLKSKDLSQQLLAIETLDKINIRQLNNEIENFLLRSDVFDDVKSLVLIALNRQSIDYKFKISHQKKIIEINPIDLDIKKLSDFNQLVSQKIESIFFEHNQTLTDLAIKISLLFLLNFFPQEFYFAVEDLVAMSLKKASKLLNKEINWKDLKKVIIFDQKVAEKMFMYELPSLD